TYHEQRRRRALVAYIAYGREYAAVGHGERVVEVAAYMVRRAHVSTPLDSLLIGKQGSDRQHARLDLPRNVQLALKRFELERRAQARHDLRIASSHSFRDKHNEIARNSRNPEHGF